MRRAALLVIALAGCSHAKSAPTPAATPAESRSLFDRLGGLPAITAVVDAFLGNVAADERINYRFASADLPDLRQKLIDQVCQATGGPCTYKGRDMVTAHRGMGIQGAEFDALVGDLQAALAHFSVPAKEPPLTPGLYEADYLVQRVRHLPGSDAHQMPALTVDRLTDSELRDIVTYLAGDPTQRIFRRNRSAKTASK